ncbi:MAG: hypothetical protein K0Q43_374 [Ramlibacter sp.]|jgi:hypothetical protein|nr:hypothetical protein [Ramlibacter sp.]
MMNIIHDMLNGKKNQHSRRFERGGGSLWALRGTTDTTRNTRQEAPALARLSR